MANAILRRFTFQTCRLALAQKRNRPTATFHRNIHQTRCLNATRLFTEQHEWLSIDGDQATVGISDYAQNQLGEIVFVELPEVGAKFAKNEPAGCLESVKAASEIYSPVSGEVTAVNEKATNEPDIINKSPDKDGWLFKIKLESVDETKNLMDQAAYDKLINSLDH